MATYSRNLEAMKKVTKGLYPNVIAQLVAEILMDEALDIAGIDMDDVSERNDDFKSYKKSASDTLVSMVNEFMDSFKDEIGGYKSDLR